MPTLDTVTTSKPAPRQDAAEPANRPLRADARRNRARVLAVANDVFAAEGVAVPIDEIARRAGVGVGTVYRHFPTKEALFEAIVTDRIGSLVEQARALAGAEDAGSAFFAFFREMVQRSVRDSGLFDALAGGGYDFHAVAAVQSGALMEVLDELVRSAQRAGAVRPDVTADDVKALMAGLRAIALQHGGRHIPESILAVVCDGLRATPS